MEANWGFLKLVVSIPLCDLQPVIRLSPSAPAMIEYGSPACSAANRPHGITNRTICIVHLHVRWFGWCVYVKLGFWETDTAPET